MASDNKFFIEIRSGENEDTITGLLHNIGNQIHPLYDELLSCLVVEIVSFENHQFARIFWGGNRILLNEVRLKLIKSEKRIVASVIGDYLQIWESNKSRKTSPDSIKSLKLKTSTDKIGFIK